VKLTLIPPCIGNEVQPPPQYLSSCLVNGTLLIDAGSFGFWSTPEEQAKVRHVLLTHTHMDHIASLPIFVENVYEGKSQGVTIHASTPVLEAVRQDVFNERLWPDFVALSEGEKPFLHLSPFEPGQTIEVEGLRITSVAVNHVVPTAGFLLSDAGATVAYLGDTGPTEEIWRLANERADLKAVFMEATFPDDLAWLAELSRHLTPRTFAEEVRKLARPVRVIATHLKARYRDRVLAELQALGLPNVEEARFGVDYEF
jgi:ribonuclease BN (tRNA processing enzyme)